MTVILPNDIEAERELLAILLRRPSLVRDAVAEVWESDFFVADHGVLFEAIARLVHRGEQPCTVAAIEEESGIDPAWLIRDVDRADTEIVLELGRRIRGKAIEREAVVPPDDMDPCGGEPPF